jgi:hypothetical protein
MPVRDLNSKVFTFVKKMTTNDLKKATSGSKNIDSVIQGL